MPNKIEKEIESLQKIKKFGTILLDHEVNLGDHKGYKGRKIAIQVSKGNIARDLGHGTMSVIGSFMGVIPIRKEDSLYDIIGGVRPAVNYFYCKATVNEYTDITLGLKTRYGLHVRVEFKMETVIEVL